MDMNHGTALGRMSAAGSSVATAEEHTIRKVGATDRSRLATVLALAFRDDPVFRWFFPEARADARREWIERACNEVFLPRLILPHDETYGSGDAIDGVAAWLPPGKAHQGVLESLALLPRLAAVWGRHVPRALRGMSRMEAEHPRDPHYYLWLMATSPECQGRGIGGAMLEHVLARNDSEGVPSYLEATSPRNRALYLRHGFQVTGEIRLPGGPPLWKMWRSVGG
jgi:GNAT superfamily N-acetyltransferase